MSAAGATAKQVTIAAVERVDDSISGWLGDLITGKGDSPSHLIANCILGCIPGVGQVIDLRDSILAIIALTASPASSAAWFELVLTLIAWIPGVGDVIKNVFKAAKSQKAVARVLDMIPKSVCGDGIKFLKEIDFADIGKKVNGYAGNAISGFIDALDSWVVKAIGGRARINGYIEALEGLLKRKNQMLAGVMRELEELRDKIIHSVTANSTAAVEAAGAGVVKQADVLAEAAAKNAGKSAKNAGEAAGAGAAKGATPPAGGGAAAGGAGGGKGTGGKGTGGDGGKGGGGGKDSPNPGGKKDRDTGKKNTETPPDASKTNQTRDYKFTKEMLNGVLAEHITDTYVYETNQKQIKVNDFGKLQPAVGTPKQGFDHLWRKKAPSSKPYVVGETKGTMRVGDMAELFALMAAIPEDLKKQLEKLHQEESDLDSPEGNAPEKASIRPDATEDDLKKRRPNQDPNNPTSGQGLNETKTKGMQMSHKWIAATFEKLERGKMDPKWAAEFGKFIERYRRKSGLENSNAKAPYERWIVLITKRQMWLHNSNQHQHRIKRPIFTLPDNVLEE